MQESIPVHVWRAIGVPNIVKTGRNCFYCGNSLSYSPFSELDELSVNFKKDRQAEEQTKWFGKKLDEMTPQDWTVHLTKNKSSNKASLIDDWLLPTTKEDSIDLYWFTQGDPGKSLCKRCGWWIDFLRYNNSATVEHTAAAVLQSYSINDNELTIPEVTAYLSGNFSDIYSLNPRKFEEVIAQVYKNAGWEVALSKQSRDGGVDIYCLSKDGEMCLVECKRYAKSRKVGIAAVDRLLGVAYRNNASSAHLVTSTKFSSPATIAANTANSVGGIELSLIDAHDLSVLLDLYADKDLTIRELKLIMQHI